MKDWLKKLFQMKRNPMSAEHRRKAHIAMLTLAAGSAIKSDDDGVIRVGRINEEKGIGV